MITQETLLDRLMVEELLSDYFWALESGGQEDVSQFYAEDAVLDVNGAVTIGRSAIKDLGRQMMEMMPPEFLKLKFHMLMSNPKISVSGNTATAKIIWTGVASDNVKAQPRLVEQGREYDEFVKIQGRWFWKKRVLTSDGGMPDLYDKTFTPR